MKKATKTYEKKTCMLAINKNAFVCDIELKNIFFGFVEFRVLL